MRRRTYLVGVAAALAGCSGAGDSAGDTAAPTDTSTSTRTATPTGTPTPCSASSSTPAPETSAHPARAPPDVVVRVATHPVSFAIIGPCGDKVYGDTYMSSTEVDVLHATPNHTGEYLATAHRQYDAGDITTARFVNGTLAPGVQLTIDATRAAGVDIETVHY